MLGLNHTTTAVLIAVTVKQPQIAAPLAFISHFVLDVIPHHGNDMEFEHNSSKFWPKIALDATLSVAVYLAAVMIWPDLTAVITACFVAALAPDLLWPVAWRMKSRKGLLWAFFKFHKGIQHESRGGIWVEYAWALTTGVVLFMIKK